MWKVFLAWKKKRNETKLNKNKTKQKKRLLYSSLSANITCSRTSWIRTCLYIQTPYCIMLLYLQLFNDAITSLETLASETNTHTHHYFFNFHLQWHELASGKKLGGNVVTYLSSLIIWWLLSTVLVNAQYCDRRRKCWLKALSSC